jgi:hypothetical protein
MWVPTDYYFEQELLGESEDSVSSPFIGVLADTYLALAVAPFPGLNRGTLLGAFTEPTFPGYARKELVWQLPYFGLNGLWNLEALAVHWQPTANVSGNLILGAMIVTAASGGMLLMAITLPGSGRDMSNIQNALTAIARFGKDPLANWGDLGQVD